MSSPHTGHELPLGHLPRAPRVTLDETIMFKPERRQNLKGLVRDISTSGAYLVSAEHFRPGTELLLYLHLPFGEKKKLCIVSAAIARIDANHGSSLSGYGIAFDEKLAVTSREALRDYVNFKESGLMPRESSLGSQRPGSAPPVRVETRDLQTPAGSLYDEIARQDRSLARLESRRQQKRRNKTILWAVIVGGFLAGAFLLLNGKNSASADHTPNHTASHASAAS